MIVKRKMIWGAIFLTMDLLLSGCSVSDAFGKLIGSTDTGTEQMSSVSEDGEKLDTRIIDPSLEKPVFLEGMTGEKDVQAGTDLVLETQASVSDGGVVTYQWYSNNVASNGGGTLLKDMRESTYHPDTAEGGTTYYYVLATNTKDGKVNLSTSEVYKVTVWEDMYWQQNADLGAYQEYIDVQTGQPIASAAMDAGEAEEAPADTAAAEEQPADTQPAEAASSEAVPAEEIPAEAPAEE